jgi:hypothetical protein
MIRIQEPLRNFLRPSSLQASLLSTQDSFTLAILLSKGGTSNKLKAQMTTLTPSPACCKTAPPAAPEYDPKGGFVQENGMKTCWSKLNLLLWYDDEADKQVDETGSSKAKNAILLIYDIFGMYPQTIQGADILASSITEISGVPTKVFMPDWFKEPADITQYPPDTPEKLAYIHGYFAVQASPDAIIPQIPGLMKAMMEKNPTIESWGVIGHCWGGKVHWSLLLLTFQLTSPDCCTCVKGRNCFQSCCAMPSIASRPG